MTSPNIGDEVSIPIDPIGLVKHKGVCVSFNPYTGEPIIAHNSMQNGYVKEVGITEFADGKTPSVKTRKTNLTAIQIQERSRKRMGTPYSVTSFNCEDFVSEVLGLNEGSPQRVFWCVVIGVGLLYMATRKSSA